MHSVICDAVTRDAGMGLRALSQGVCVAGWENLHELTVMSHGGRKTLHLLRTVDQRTLASAGQSGVRTRADCNAVFALASCMSHHPAHLP